MRVPRGFKLFGVGFIGCDDDETCICCKVRANAALSEFGMLKTFLNRLGTKAASEPLVTNS